MHDRDDLVQCPSQLGGEANEPVLFLLGNRNPRRQLTPQNLGLDLEVTDLSGEFLLRRAGDDEQQGPVDVPHGANPR
jgi:hypothetical protein